MGERSKWRCARPAFKAGNGDMVRPGLADTGSDSAEPDFRHKLHRDARAGVYVLQIVDELGPIPARTEAMVGRGRDQRGARLRMADLGAVLVLLVRSDELQVGKVLFSPGRSQWGPNN